MDNNLHFRTSDVTYIVQPGDNLYTIAQKFNTTVDKLMNLNQLHNTILLVGQILIIRKEEVLLEHIGSDICGTYKPFEETKYDLYTVKAGDNLNIIAKKYQTTVSNLIYINNLSNTVLNINQILKVPKVGKKKLTYIVKKGDSLYSIASDYHLTPKQIIDFNNLQSNSLEIGQQLFIPQ